MANVSIDDLRQAIDKGQLHLHYQPKVSLQNDKIIGMEALVRWQHPNKGMLLPLHFAELAEQIGIMTQISHWVFMSAGDFISRMKKNGLDNLTLAVNISATQLKQEDFNVVIKELLETCKKANFGLEIELTESINIEDINQVAADLQKLREQRANIVIDDFGTAYSTLRYLQLLPVDKVKIDKLFVDTITSQNKQPIVNSIINLAHELNIKVIAEGVENQTQLDYLKAHACDEAQGYYFSEPVSEKDFIALLKKQ